MKELLEKIYSKLNHDFWWFMDLLDDYINYLKALMNKIHSKFGDFWWYALLIFLAQRIGDLINATVGLWLVPKYVPAEELGAVLPLTQFATFLALPLAFLTTTFTKFVNKYQSLGEAGKVKSFLKFFIWFAIIVTVLNAAVSLTLMPHIFERINVEQGSLAVLIIACGLLNTVNPVFVNALQGLKKFKTLSLLGVLSAPIRLATMVIAMPFRALSGYMLGQCVPTLFSIIASAFSLRKHVNRDIVSDHTWTKEWNLMLKYFLWIAAASVPSQIFVTIQAMVIRQRLPEVESAAYYVISRFAEIATYGGATLIFVMFPLAAEANAKGKENTKVLNQMQFGTVIFAGVCTLVLYFCGPYILNLLDTTRPYVMYSTDMSILAAGLALGYLWGNYTHFEIANNRFTFVYYSLPISLTQAAFLICFCGVSNFHGILPDSIINWMSNCHIATLRNINLSFLYFNIFRVAITFVERAWRTLKAHR